MIKLILFNSFINIVPAENFEYTRGGDCVEIDGVDDKKDFQETCHALTLLGKLLYSIPYVLSTCATN